MKMLMSILLVLTILGDFSCKESPPQPYIPAVVLVAEDVGVTDAFLRVHLTRPDSLSTILIKRNGRVVLTARMGTRTDTLLTDDSLSPSQTYHYRAYRAFQVPFDSSDAITITTIDSTGHSFSFQIDTLGDGNSSVLKDVAIVNDTCVYAVGEIYVKDSLGNFDPLPYNAAVWNGTSWKLERVTVMHQGFPVTPPLEGILAFSQTDIWLSAGVPIHGDGQTWTQYHLFDMGVLGQNDGSITKLWGLNSNNLYFVGRKGTIVHFDGTTWQKLESGTTLDVQDIYGARNPKNDSLEILAVASNPFSSYDRKILEISGTSVSAISDGGIIWPLSGIWFIPGRHYYAVGSGIYEKRILQDIRWQNDPLQITTYYSNTVRGTELNNVFVGGAYGDLLHFNGLSWKSYHEQIGSIYGQFLTLTVRGKKVFAVGEAPPRAMVLRGTLE